VQDPQALTDRLRDPLQRNTAFSELVKVYQRRVYGVIRKMVIDHDEADDLTQEVFVKVWNNLDKFKGDSNIFTWIYRIATNESLQHLRKRRSQSWFRTDFTEQLENQLVSDTYIDADALQLKLQKAVLQLPDKQRLVFNLKYFEELTYEEIAEITDSSVGSLKASFHHATKKVEEFLQDD
jgi:RNA polymerase sigma factor (sigma-70 family)